MWLHIVSKRYSVLYAVIFIYVCVCALLDNPGRMSAGLEGFASEMLSSIMFIFKNQEWTL